MKTVWIIIAVLLGIAIGVAFFYGVMFFSMLGRWP